MRRRSGDGGMSGAEPDGDAEEDNHRLMFAEEGATAELIYRRRGDRLILVHTEVPEHLGGRGIGGRLVQAATERAATQGLTLVPSCPYARNWLRDHPDIPGTVAIDRQPPVTQPCPG